jgi:MSHA pilin protein MshD
MVPFPRETKAHASQSGLSLMEVVVSVMIMVPVLVMVLSAFFRNVTSVTEAWEETRSVAVAQRLMDKIRVMRWDETAPIGGTTTVRSALGPDGETSSDQFDDIDDWNGFSGPDPIPAYSRYTRTVRVDYIVQPITGTAAVSVTDTDIKRVSITVIGPVGKPVVISGLFYNSFP